MANTTANVNVALLRESAHLMAASSDTGTIGFRADGIVLTAQGPDWTKNSMSCKISTIDLGDYQFNGEMTYELQWIPLKLFLTGQKGVATLEAKKASISLNVPPSTRRLGNILKIDRCEALEQDFTVMASVEPISIKEFKSLRLAKTIGDKIKLTIWRKGESTSPRSKAGLIISCDGYNNNSLELDIPTEATTHRDGTFHATVHADSVLPLIAKLPTRKDVTIKWNVVKGPEPEDPLGLSAQVFNGCSTTTSFIGGIEDEE